jgi:hypothetical protein
MDLSRWTLESSTYRDNGHTVAVFFYDGPQNWRVEVSIATDMLQKFGDVADNDLPAKKTRALRVLRAMLERFVSKVEPLSGQLEQINETHVDILAIAKEFRKASR